MSDRSHQRKEHAGSGQGTDSSAGHGRFTAPAVSRGPSVSSGYTGSRPTGTSTTQGHGGPPPLSRASSGSVSHVGYGSGQPGRHHIQGQEQAVLVDRLSRLSISSAPSEVAIRPGYGTKGNTIAVYANLFVMKYPSFVLYDYVIDIKPDVKDKSQEHQRIFEALENTTGFQGIAKTAVHDGACRLVSGKKLPDTLTITVQLETPTNDGQNSNAVVYQVSFTKCTELNPTDLTRYLNADPAYTEYNVERFVSALQLIATANISKGGVQFGRNVCYYASDVYGEGKKDLSPGVEAWRGFFTSVRPVYKNLMVNVSSCMKPFFTPAKSLVHAYEEYQRLSLGAGPPPSEFFQGVMVTTTHLGYEKKARVKGFGRSADQTVLESSEFGEVSVSVFFQKKYGIQLKNSQAPVVNVGPRGTRAMDVWIPMELCSIKQGQEYQGKLTYDGAVQMSALSSTTPFVNSQSIIHQGLHALGYTSQRGTLSAFNVTVEKSMTLVPARVLDPPRIQYGSSQATVQDGMWSMYNAKFNKPASLVGVTVLVIKDGVRDDFTGNTDPTLRQAVQAFMELCRSKGMEVDGKPPQLRIAEGLPQLQDDPYRSHALRIIEQTITTFSPKPTLILVFMPKRDVHLYPGLKTLCDIKLGVPTVCMLNNNARDLHTQTRDFSCVALKVNTKLGGVNHVLDPASTRWLEDTMLVGVEVAPPGSIDGVKGVPAIVTVVASSDNRFMNYPASTKTVSDYKKWPAEEIGHMLAERMNVYQANTGKTPQRIIIFRNGVSEGKQQKVHGEVISRIKSTLNSLGYNPKITFVLCNKGHQVRAFVQNRNDGDHSGNTPAGTVIDKNIVSVFKYDFYLQAHSCAQGTAKPTHYTIIQDENGYGADAIQNGMNSLSYMQARSTSSTSVVPPLYWACTALARAKSCLREVVTAPDIKNLNESQVYERVKRVWGNAIHEALKNTMYYL